MQTSYHSALQWGVNDRMARLMYALDYWSRYYEVALPVMISGYRSPGVQASLQARWDRGDRTGLAVRPASRSKHTERKAFDLEDNGLLQWYGTIAAYYGYDWGGNFTASPDPGHFFTR